MCLALVTWNEELTVALGIFSDAFEGDHDFIYSQALAAITVLNPVFTITFVLFSKENDWEVQTMFTFWCLHFQKNICRSEELMLVISNDFCR